MLCSRTQNQLSAYCDRELSGTEMLEIQRHLHSCAMCREEHEGMQTVKGLLRSAPDVQPTAQFDMGVVEMRAAQSRNTVAWGAVRQSLSAATAPFLDAVRQLFRSLGSLRHYPRQLHALHWDGGAVALGCAVGALILTLGTVRQPQRAATAAQIPTETVASDMADAAPQDRASMLFGGPMVQVQAVPGTYSPWQGPVSWQSASQVSYVGYRSGWSPR